MQDWYNNNKASLELTSTITDILPRLVKGQSPTFTDNKLGRVQLTLDLKALLFRIFHKDWGTH